MGQGGKLDKKYVLLDRTKIVGDLEKSCQINIIMLNINNVVYLSRLNANQVLNKFSYMSNTKVQ